MLLGGYNPLTPERPRPPTVSGNVAEPVSLAIMRSDSSARGCLSHSSRDGPRNGNIRSPGRRSTLRYGRAAAPSRAPIMHGHSSKTLRVRSNMAAWGAGSPEAQRPRAQLKSHILKACLHLGCGFSGWTRHGSNSPDQTPCHESGGLVLGLELWGEQHGLSPSCRKAFYLVLASITRFRTIFDSVVPMPIPGRFKPLG